MAYLSDCLLHLRVRARSLPQHRQDLVEALLLRLPAHSAGKMKALKVSVGAESARVLFSSLENDEIGGKDMSW